MFKRKTILNNDENKENINPNYFPDFSNQKL